MRTDKYKNGMKVVFTKDFQKIHPEFYPPIGTKGVIVEADGTSTPRIKWFGFRPFVCGEYRDSAYYHDGNWKLIEYDRPPKILITVDKADPQKVIAKDLDSGKTGVAKCNPTDTFNFMTGAKLAFARLCGEDAPKPTCKFKVGDKIIGNEKANRYGITRQGWKGVVTEVLKEPMKRTDGADAGMYWTFKAHSINNDMNFYLADDAFDLLPEPKGWNGKVVCVDPCSIAYLTAGKVYAVKDGVLRDNRGNSVISDIITGPDDFKRKDLFSSKFIEYKGEA